MEPGEPGARGVLVLLGHDDVDAPAGEHRQRDLRLLLDDLHLQRGMRVRDRAERGDDERVRGGLEGGDADRPADLPGGGRELGLDRFELCEHVAGPRDEGVAGVGQLEPAAGLAEELDARLALELGQLLGDGRRGEGQGVGRAGDRALRGELPQDGQPAGREHLSDLLKQYVRNHRLF